MSRRSARIAGKKNQEEKKKLDKSEETFGLIWNGFDEYFFVLDSDINKGSPKIAAFDLDGTIIKTKSGKKYPTGRNDWEWWHDSVPEKLLELHNSGFKIVLFTNQGGIEKDFSKKGEITGKILDIVVELKFPIQAYIAGGEDVYRKPHKTMWEYMVTTLNGGIEPDMNISFFCGDAAGRPKNWKKGAKKDFSCCDRKFAANIGLIFHTPEEFFLEEKVAEFEWGSVSPIALCEELMDKKLPYNSYESEEQEMIIMVGYPASGKSTFTKKYFPNYSRINRDTLGTNEKCIKVAKEALKEGLSVVIDNTNGQSSTRKKFISIAQEVDVPVRCFYFTTSLEIAEHLNYVRVRETKGKVRRIPAVAYNTYKKNFTEPSKSEGYSEIILIDFIPDFTDNPKLKEMFMQWT